MANFDIPGIKTFPDVEYNCFVSLAEADSYHARRLANSLWRTAEEDVRTSALFHATDILHRQKWIGAPKDYDQAYSWPRRFVPNRNSINQGFTGDLEYIDINTPVSLTFRYLDDDSIPQFLKDATAELANYLIQRAASGKTEVSQYDDQLASVSLGSLNISLREESAYITDMPHQVYHIVSDFLREVKEIDPSIKGVFNSPVKRG